MDPSDVEKRVHVSVNGMCDCEQLPAGCPTCILFSVLWVSAGEQLSLLCCSSSSGKHPVSWVFLQSFQDLPQINNSIQDDNSGKVKTRTGPCWPPHLCCTKFGSIWPCRRWGAPPLRGVPGGYGALDLCKSLPWSTKGEELLVHLTEFAEVLPCPVPPPSLLAHPFRQA